MADVTRERRIDVGADQVWAALADFGTISTWAPNVDHSCLLSNQTAGVGMVRRIQAGRVTVVETVEHWDPGVSLRYSITGLPAVVRSVTNTWQLAAVDNGASTAVSLTTAIDAGPRPPQRAIAKVIGRKLGQASVDMLAGLVAHPSAHPAAHPSAHPAADPTADPTRQEQRT